MKKLVCAMVLALIVPVSAYAFETREILSLVAMPLAVAAVSEMTDVPPSDLFTLISLLNQADVPPAQFVEIVRYVPVALVDTTEPRFTTYVTTQFRDGVVGIPLATVIAERIQLLGVREINVVNPPVLTVVRRAEYIPPVVITHVKAHPHGGPPGQLKKIRGVQTGAAIVHDDDNDVRRRGVVIDNDRSNPVKVKKEKKEKNESAREDRNDDRDRVRVKADKPDKSDHGNHGKGNSGKGKGKGKG